MCIWNICLFKYLNFIYRAYSFPGNGTKRPVYSIKSEMVVDIEDVSSKYLDPNEDDDLLCYLKTGKHLDGVSKRF